MDALVKPKASFVSVVAPAFNEGDGIAVVTRQWCAILTQMPWVERFEIVIADDGSTDNTVAVLRTLQNDGLPIRLVELGANRGAGVALKEGLSNSRGDYVLLTDSDGQFDLRDSQQLWAVLLTSGADMVVGNRPEKRDNILLRIGSRASAAAIQYALGTQTIDVNSAFKLGHGPFMRALPLEARHLNYSADVLCKAIEFGGVVAACTVSHSQRRAGTSSAKLLEDGAARIAFTGYCLLRQALIRRRVIDIQRIRP